MPGLHALLSPSAAHRWLNCTAAPRLEAEEENTDTDFTREGTLAHAYCAKKLKTFLGLPTTDEDKEIEELSGQYHTGEMDEYTDTYYAMVMERFNAIKVTTPDALLMVETRLDFSKFIPDAFGTADAIIIADGLMEVIDFKYGKGVLVEAEENPQMMIYALGAYEEYSMEYDINRVRMTIIQPRKDNLSEYNLDVKELLHWATMTLKPKAKEAFSGKGPQTPGAWCRFCRVKASCRALATKCTETAQKTANPGLVSPSEMATEVLPQIPIIKAWLSAIEEHSLAQALAGVTYPGYKLVEGRSVRKISEPTKVRDLLTGQGFDEAAVIRPQELRTLTDLERLVGKKRFTELCGDFIVKPQGKPKLVPNSDKRQPFNAAVEDFNGIDF